MPHSSLDVYWMALALALARHAASLDEIPVGALIVAHHPLPPPLLEELPPALLPLPVPPPLPADIAHPGTLLSAGYNRREADADPSAHAEIVAIRHAARRLNQWRLLDCTLYVTLEPCPMCAGALVNARLPRLVYGCTDPKAGAVHTLYQLCSDPRLNHRVEIVPDILAVESAALLREFFATRRRPRQP